MDGSTGVCYITDQADNRNTLLQREQTLRDLDEALMFMLDATC